MGKNGKRLHPAFPILQKYKPTPSHCSPLGSRRCESREADVVELRRMVEKYEQEFSVTAISSPVGCFLFKSCYFFGRFQIFFITKVYWLRLPCWVQLVSLWEDSSLNTWSWTTPPPLPDVFISLDRGPALFIGIRNVREIFLNAVQNWN